jgi:hypothetical protein
MTRIAIGGLCMALLAGAAAPRAQEPAQRPASGAEHAWLGQLAGEWEAVTEAVVAPGQPPLQSKGTESIRRLGDSWVVSEVESSFMDMPFSAVFTLGYDPEAKKFVGTWVDSLSSYLWRYEGTLDAEGKTLTLEKEGPCVRTPGTHARFRDVLEVKGPRERTYTSRALIDGAWETIVTVHSRRRE